MYKCILWGTGKIFSQYINAIKYFEMCNQLEVVGVTSNNAVFDRLIGYPFVHKNDLKQLDVDIILVMARLSAKDVQKEAAELGITNVLIIPYRVLNIPSFSFEKYVSLKKETPSIITNNCWGGITYHYLGLEFASPFINMFVDDADYLRLLRDPEKYLRANLVYQEDEYNLVESFWYPVCLCDDILLHFNHYKSFDSAKSYWEKRKKRICWGNLFVMMYTEDENVARQFSKLPYHKKICFVPFPSNDDSVCPINFRNTSEMAKLEFWEIVLRMASGAIPYYNAVDLIHDGKINVLSNPFELSANGA